jgi:hypothetical protein
MAIDITDVTTPDLFHKPKRNGEIQQDAIADHAVRLASHHRHLRDNDAELALAKKRVRTLSSLALKYNRRRIESERRIAGLTARLDNLVEHTARLQRRQKTVDRRSQRSRRRLSRLETVVR